MNTRRQNAEKEKISLHHALPVAVSLAHLDWHLRNLDIGWQVIEAITQTEHKKRHEKRSYLTQSLNLES